MAYDGMMELRRNSTAISTDKETPEPLNLRSRNASQNEVEYLNTQRRKLESPDTPESNKILQPDHGQTSPSLQEENSGKCHYSSVFLMFQRSKCVFATTNIDFIYQYLNIILYRSV